MKYADFPRKKDLLCEIEKLEDSFKELRSDAEVQKRFAKNVNLLRGLRGFNVTALARKVGCDRIVMRRILIPGDGYFSHTSLKWICGIADVLGVSPDLLLTVDLCQKLEVIIKHAEEQL